ncbi:VWA domain-containing protein [Vibrio crassostreae]|nr:VWA domain-containing protein [Vibrio crassostreae]CAK3146271.1 VWA domain-containing protein [Vibrio crassostreae]CAK3310190.1 VWA domain-containing protein [Vibrio crassostreae]CAK3636945.1 VWA domain-containing protein [Vibrio crassostreae]CAK3674264.1 VWA domain-containing protein [Vibrio crassostreae]
MVNSMFSGLARQQKGSITLSFWALLIPALFIAVGTLMISAQVMVSNRAAQAADSAALACAYADEATPRMMRAYQDYYHPTLKGVSGLPPENQDCRISLGYSVNLLLPRFNYEQYDQKVTATSGGFKGVVESKHSAIPTELVLVLDVSGSMGSNMSSLKSILSKALNTIQSQSNNTNDLDSVSISIVPFDSGVATHRPPWLSKEAAGIYCIDGLSYRNGDFSAALTVDNLATLHSERPVKFTPPSKWLSDCNQESPMLPLTSVFSRVQNSINSLTANGGTRSYQGLVWGVRQLIPSWQQAWGIKVNSVPETRRKLVLFTDGADEGDAFNQLVNAGFCTTAIKQYGIEMNFIGYGVSPSRITQFENCAGNPLRVFSATNTTQLNEYFSDILAVEYSASIRLTR